MKRIFLIMGLVLTSLSINAQITLSQLKGTWEQYEPSDEYRIKKMIFTETTLTSTTYRKRLDSSTSYIKDYYLNSKIPSSFDFSAVGKHNSGIYIIEYNDACNRLEAYQIEDFSSNTLSLRIKQLRPVIGSNKETIVRYKRVK